MADQQQYTATVSILEQMNGAKHVRLVITDDETGETVKDTTLNPDSVFPEERNPRGLTGRVLGGSGFKMSGDWLAEPTSFPVTLHVTRA